jgi:methylated-DNA-protein-cysteine methyltransferase related protein
MGLPMTAEVTPDQATLPDWAEGSPLLTCYARIYRLVRAIPPGQVTTYGALASAVATLCPSPVPAITVGRAMAASTRYAPDVPWWRVIGRAGRWGVLRSLRHSAVQRALLAGEGIHPDDEGRYDLARCSTPPHC